MKLKSTFANRTDKAPNAMFWVNAWLNKPVLGSIIHIGFQFMGTYKECSGYIKNRSKEIDRFILRRR